MSTLGYQPFKVSERNTTRRSPSVTGGAGFLSAPRTPSEMTRFTDQTARPPAVDAARETTRTPQESALVAQKVNYLERQEKILQQRISDERAIVADGMRAIREQVVDTVYARALCDLHGASEPDAAAHAPESDATMVVAAKGDMCALAFPALSQSRDGVTDYTMRCKCVDGATGQVTMRWVVVLSETSDAKMHRFIGPFASVPT